MPEHPDLVVVIEAIDYITGPFQERILPTMVRCCRLAGLLPADAPDPTTFRDLNIAIAIHKEHPMPEANREHAAIFNTPTNARVDNDAVFLQQLASLGWTVNHQTADTGHTVTVHPTGTDRSQTYSAPTLAEIRQFILDDYGI